MHVHTCMLVYVYVDVYACRCICKIVSPKALGRLSLLSMSMCVCASQCVCLLCTNTIIFWREFFCKGNTLTERENIEILRKNDRLCIVCVYLVGCVVCFNGLHRVL